MLQLYCIVTGKMHDTIREQGREGGGGRGVHDKKKRGKNTLKR